MDEAYWKGIGDVLEREWMKHIGKGLVTCWRGNG